MTVVHEPNELLVSGRGDKADARIGTQDTINRLLNLRVKVDGVKNSDLRMQLSQPIDSLADALKASTEGFAAMTGDKDEGSTFTREISLGKGSRDTNFGRDLSGA
jgi:hypothetical protein